LSLNLVHCPPKIFFNPQIDTLYFGSGDEGLGLPAREASLEPFRNFVAATTLLDRVETGRVRRLAVSEALFQFRYLRAGTTDYGSTSWATEDEGRMDRFWNVVLTKFEALQELIFLVERSDEEIEESEREKGLRPSPPFLFLRAGRKNTLKRRVEMLENRLEGALRTWMATQGRREWDEVPRWSVVVRSAGEFDH
jgi:hypothetical protein